MTFDELVIFITKIKDLTGHRFLDTDGEYSYKIHSDLEVALRVARALTEEFSIVPLDHMIFKGESVG